MLNTRIPTGSLYRIASGTEPWEYPDWKRADKSSSQAHTFGNRFDDPNAEYRVLYASSQLVSCYVEVLARFRPDYALLAELRAMDGEDDYQQIGVIPDEWFESRFIGTAEVDVIILTSTIGLGFTPALEASAAVRRTWAVGF